MRNFLSKEDIIVLQEAHHAAREKRKADRIKTVKEVTFYVETTYGKRKPLMLMP